MAIASTLLWQLESPNSQGPSYLFGTMHVKDHRAFGFFDKVCEKVDCCNMFATEFDFRKADPIAAQEAMSLPPGIDLLDLLGEKKYQKLRRILLKSFNLDLRYFRYTQPLLVNNMLAEKIMSADMPQSLDEALWTYAEEQGKKLAGVEAFEEQLRIMQSIPVKEQVKSLIRTGRNISLFRKKLQHTIDLYAAADLQRLHLSAKNGLHGLRKPMLYDRNKRMAKKIVEFIQTDTVVFAIGAGHLAGGKGVLRLLKQAGIKYRPIKMKS